MFIPIPTLHPIVILIYCQQAPYLLYFCRMFKHSDENTDRADEVDIQDVNFEPEDELGDMGAAQAKIKKLRYSLKEAQQKRDEYLDGWQRSKADSINARKEAFAAADRQALHAKESVIGDIIPVLDSFDMAATSGAWESVDESWRSGIDQIRNQLLDTLARHGVTRYGKVGEMSNHNLHEIVQEMEDVAGAPGEIVRILRYGYKTGESILRPAQIIVKK